MRLSVNVLQDATQVFRQSDCMDRCKYRIKQHSGLLSGQPGVCDIIIPLVMQNSYKHLIPEAFAKHGTQQRKIQLRGPENKECYFYDGTSKTKRALSVERQIEEDGYDPKTLRIEDQMCQFPLILHLYFINLKRHIRLDRRHHAAAAQAQKSHKAQLWVVFALYFASL